MKVTREANGEIWVDGQLYTRAESSPTIAETRALARRWRERADRAEAVADFLEAEAKAQLAEYTKKVDKVAEILERMAPPDPLGFPNTPRDVAAYLVSNGVMAP